MDKIEYRIEKSNRKTAWTYCIYEDKEKGKLHMAIFRESPISFATVAIVENLRADEMQKRIESINNWRNWKDCITDIFKIKLGMATFVDYSVIVSSTMTRGKQYRIIIDWPHMGTTGREAFEFLRKNI